MKRFKLFIPTLLPKQRGRNIQDITHNQREYSIKISKTMEGVTEKIPIHYVVNILKIKLLNITILSIEALHVMKLLCRGLGISLSTGLRHFTKSFDTNLQITLHKLRGQNFLKVGGLSTFKIRTIRYLAT